MVKSFSAKNLKEALKIMASNEVTLYAGGTDLMIKNSSSKPYLFLNKIEELKQIFTDNEYIHIGAAVTFTEALKNSLVPQLMKDALIKIAAPAIRNAGTFGGNLANASAKADSVLIEYATDAELHIISPRGERFVAVDRFYLGNRKVDLAPDEIITEILLPKEGWDNYYYEKVGGRNALAISRVSFASVFNTRGGAITQISVCFGAVSDTVLRFKEIERMMLTKSISEAKNLKSEFINAYKDKLVLTQGRVSAEYRKSVCINLLTAALESFGI